MWGFFNQLGSEELEKRLKNFIFITLIILISLASITLFLRIIGLFKTYVASGDAIVFDENLTPEEKSLLEETNTLLERENEALNMADTILSFLEGASVLVALALGAAAIFGIQNSRELRSDIEKQTDGIKNDFKEFKQDFAETSNKQKDELVEQQELFKGEIKLFRDEFSGLRTSLETTSRKIQDDFVLERGKISEDLAKNQAELETKLAQSIASIQEVVKKLDNRITQLDPIFNQLPEQIDTITNVQSDFLDLLQASQELSLKNHEQAYNYVSRVLTHSPQNVQALYLAGWLETQYIPNMLPKAIEHLNQAIELDPTAMSLKAALGVAIRRQALQEDKNVKLLKKSLRILEEALEDNKNLIDPNRESFWGPVGGNYRDLDNIEEAIKAYETARAVTPASSYPVGNLGALYLYKAKFKNEPQWIDTSLKMFDLTVRLSDREKAFSPNDYFVLMDLAMSYTMLSSNKQEYLEDAQEWFETANSDLINATPGMLKVSLGGWKRLEESCPENWHEIQQQLNIRIQQMNEVIGQRETPPPSDNEVKS